jgi:O-antigen/teichoic acid export membrane protein
MVAGSLSIALSLGLIPRMQSAGAALSAVISLGIALVLFLAIVGFHLSGQRKQPL